MEIDFRKYPEEFRLKIIEKVFEIRRRPGRPRKAVALYREMIWETQRFLIRKSILKDREKGLAFYREIIEFSKKIECLGLELDQILQVWADEEIEKAFQRWIIGKTARRIVVSR